MTSLDLFKPPQEIRELNLLQELEKNPVVSQRELSSKFGIALGVTNACLKRMARRGWIRVTAGLTHRRIGYYLTPKGFAEKAKLTVHLISWTMQHYSVLKDLISKGLLEMQNDGVERVVFYGVSDEMEIAYVTLQGVNLKLVGIVEDEDKINRKEVFGFELKDIREIEMLRPDAVLITSLANQAERTEKLANLIDVERVRIWNIPSSLTPEIVIEPSKGWVSLKLGELWQYRELLFFLIWRDVKVRYKQAVLGIAWAIIQPLVTMVIFSVIFGQLAKLPSEGIPYPVFCYAALLPWQFFSGALTRCGTSLVGNANLLTKVYFPRLIIPLSATLSGLVDFAISFIVLLGLMLYYRMFPTWAVLWLPLLVIFTLVTALSVGLWLSALNVQYRDVQHIIPFLIQAWMFASPVVYSAELIPSGPWRFVYGLNPLTGVIQGFRWILLGTRPPHEWMIVSAGVVVILIVTGLYYFRRMEKSFADVV